VTGTPDDQKQRVVAYYQETTKASYLANWSGAALSFHFGLSDATTRSLDEAHVASNAYLADALEMRPGSRVLDAGCGVGGTSMWLAEQRGVRAIAITLDPAQVALGRRFAAERGVGDRVSFEVLDYAALPMGDGSFDAVFNLESLCHCVTLGEYFRGVLRVLAPGGRYGCMEFFAGDGRPDLVQEVMDTWAMPGWKSMGVVEEELRSAGFEDVRALDLTPRVVRSAEQMRAMAHNSVLVNKLQRAIDGQSRPLLDAHVRGAIACCEGLLSGGVTYGFVSGRRREP
jgi:cyclopropane fatty-acyl-phospholipid synthase-like methyltransferase